MFDGCTGLTLSGLGFAWQVEKVELEKNWFIDQGFWKTILLPIFLFSQSIPHYTPSIFSWNVQFVFQPRGIKFIFTLSSLKNKTTEDISHNFLVIKQWKFYMLFLSFAFYPSGFQTVFLIYFQTQLMYVIYEWSTFWLPRFQDRQTE